ncbi:MAG: hypothetical protein V3W04_05295 [Gammaproteobacteria bacterium]
MNNSEAKEMLASLLTCQHSLDEALLVAERISAIEEKEQLKEILMSVIADIYIEAIRKIVIQHPDLEPYPT